MGNILSTAPTGNGNAEPVKSESETMNTNKNSDDQNSENVETSFEEEARVKAKEEEMNEFKKQLSLKRELRREILDRHRAEKEELERSLQREKATVIELCESNKLLCNLLSKNNIEIPENVIAGKNETALTLIHMREEVMLVKLNNTQLRKDLVESNSALQSATSDIADLSIQNTECLKQIQALKEVVSVSKTMISLREQQLLELKNKLNDIEQTLADRETDMLSADLRQEYERQLQNIRTLRGLYEERARLAEVTRQGLVRELNEHKMLYQAEVKKCKDLTQKVEGLETRVDTLIETIENKNLRISSYQEETNGLSAQMAVVNKLFSQVLLGYKTKQDLDTLVHRLEENHGILTQMAERENGSEISAALPKLLLELVSQVDARENDNSGDDCKINNELSHNKTVSSLESVSLKVATTAEDIVENLPKVWKVLIELLSHQNTPDTDLETTAKVTTCYKSVNTASGPVLVPSVSQTYIRLKDLIIEKLGLIREVSRMKQLNTHLETRLEEQERRLCLVTSELSKTWHVVGRLRRHHHQLHTHEKILKYELQQKRKLLNELKEELEYCREKWEQAREKNTQSEKDWRKLRAEFSSRKTKSGSSSFNHSGESGYSDERPSDDSSESNDESEYVAEPLIRCKKKGKKSFEIAIDSSTDMNLVAEREDPASDMLDVADLPLDTQENEENYTSVSGSSKGELISKHEIICEETEDEMFDITQDDSCNEEAYTEATLNSIRMHECDVINDPSSSTPLEDTVEILKNLKPNNDILLKRDVQSNKLTDSSISSTTSKEETQSTSKISVKLNEVPADPIGKPTINQSNSTEENIPETLSSETRDTSLAEHLKSEPFENDVHSLTQIVDTSDNFEKLQQNYTPNFKIILENVRKQQERLAKKDERLQRLENDCSKVVKDISSTLNSENEMLDKLEDLHRKNDSLGTTEENFNDESFILQTDDIGPSTSSEVNHEARFAARDLRLKLLEEQTKSLVNKVNKTTSKGVKIHYKLEELHNIYGSENSRAGTPSEENEDKITETESPDEE